MIGSPRNFFGTVPSSEEDMPKARKPSHMISSPKEIYSGHVQLYSNSVQIFDGEAVYHKLREKLRYFLVGLFSFKEVEDLLSF